MSVHKECGDQIRWARTANGTKWLPPLELVGEAFILTKNEEGEGEYVGTEMMTYRVHNCDPDKVEAWQTYKERLAAIEDRKTVTNVAGYSDRVVAKMRDQENAWAEVWGTPCPKCLCEGDAKCINLNKVREGGEVVYTVWPHPERVAELLNG